MQFCMQEFVLLRRDLRWLFRDARKRWCTDRLITFQVEVWRLHLSRPGPMATSTTPQPYTADRPENSTTSVDASVGLPLYRSLARWMFSRSALISSRRKRVYVLLLGCKVSPYAASSSSAFFSRDGKMTGDSPPRYTLSSSRNQLKISRSLPPEFGGR
jgi:hypothetical protein